MTRRAAVAVVVLLAALTAAGFVVLGADDDERPGAAAIDRYLAAWARGDDAGAATLTDKPGAARRGLEVNRAGLDGARVATRVVSRRDDERVSAARVRVAWDVPRFGRFAYETRIVAVEGEAGWRVRWRDDAVHPVLA